MSPAPTDPPAKPEPKGEGSGLDFAKELLIRLIDMRTPHFLMPPGALSHLASGGILLAAGSVIFALVRMFQAATPSPLAENLLAVLVSYGVLCVAGVVALRERDQAAVFEDWSKFSNLTFMLLLATAFLYALVSGVFGEIMGQVPVNYFQETNEYVVRFSVALICSLFVVAFLSWRTRRIHAELWTGIRGKHLWAAFYTLLVAGGVTWIASF